MGFWHALLDILRAAAPYIIVAWVTQQLAFAYQRRAQVFQLKHSVFEDFLNAYAELEHAARAVTLQYPQQMVQEAKEALDRGATPKTVGRIRPEHDAPFVLLWDKFKSFIARFAIYDCRETAQTTLGELIASLEELTRMEREWFTKLPEQDFPAFKHMQTQLRTATEKFVAIVEMLTAELYGERRRRLLFMRRKLPTGPDPGS